MGSLWGVGRYEVAMWRWLWGHGDPGCGYGAILDPGCGYGAIWDPGCGLWGHGDPGCGYGAVGSPLTVAVGAEDKMAALCDHLELLLPNGGHVGDGGDADEALGENVLWGQ